MPSIEIVWLKPNSSDWISMSNSLFTDSSQSCSVITVFLSAKIVHFLGFFTHVCLVNTITSYDIYNSLTLVDNSPCEIYQQNMKFQYGVSSFRMLASSLNHSLCHHLLHIICIHLVCLELYHMFHILLYRYIPELCCKLATQTGAWYLVPGTRYQGGPAV